MPDFSRQTFGAQALLYLRSLRSLGLRQLAGVGLLVALGAVVEGLGLVLLVPLVAELIAANGRNARVPHWLTALGLDPGALPLMPMLALFAVVLVVRSVILWQRDLRTLALSLRYVDGWRMRLIESLAAASWSGLLSMPRSRLEFAITSEVNRLAVGSDRLLRGAIAAVQIAVQLGVAFLLTPALAALALGLVVITAPLLLPLLRAAHRQGVMLSEDGRARYALLGDFVSGMKLAKAHNAEQRYVADFAGITDGLRDRMLAFANAQLGGGAAFQIAAGLLAGTVLLLGLFVTHTPLPVLSAVLLLLARLSGPMMQLGQGAQALTSMLPAVVGLDELNVDLRRQAAPAAPVSERFGGHGGAAIALRGLGYTHSGSSTPTLAHIDLAIPAGAVVALLGRSGSGKTTLADLLTGLLSPSAGALEVDGHPLSDAADRAAWRERVAYVPQEPFLFDRSLRENLLWSAPAASDDAIWEALRIAEAARFVAALPEGLGTSMGERGQRLSGGERQRICFARALLRAPRLLILDEATSALDPATEQRLLAGVAALRGRCTVLAIAHRLPPDFRPDLVLRLDHGVIRPAAESFELRERRP